LKHVDGCDLSIICLFCEKSASEQNKFCEKWLTEMDELWQEGSSTIFHNLCIIYITFSLAMLVDNATYKGSGKKWEGAGSVCPCCAY
jgi:hypothetical protein